MRAERALAIPETLHDLGDRHHRGVAGEDGVRPHVPLDLAEQFLLERHILEHGLDHIVGVAHAIGHSATGVMRATAVLVIP